MNNIAVTKLTFFVLDLSYLDIKDMNTIIGSNPKIDPDIVARNVDNSSH
jgi:hypothetical protein